MERCKIPLLTDLLEFPLMYNQEKEYHDVQICKNQKVWDPTRLADLEVKYFLVQARKLWPDNCEY